MCSHGVSIRRGQKKGKGTGPSETHQCGLALREHGGRHVLEAGLPLEVLEQPAEGDGTRRTRAGRRLVRQRERDFWVGGGRGAGF